ncbi:hypothetical protein [Zobellia nedashkovskayae]|uniref:hypothetical protein n=1 Tax=Zobellia nedashkovskayae TaxID=2779510 RepID=UPI00188B1A35|nr:hypothetical protein [Zobellia nedashkovskayae]
MSKKKKTHRSNSVSKNKGNEKIFWTYLPKPNGAPAYKIDRALLSDWLTAHNYRIIPNFGEWQVVKVNDNIVEIKLPQEVYNDALSFIAEQEINDLRSCFIEQGENMLMAKKAILGSLPQLNIPHYSDTRETVRIFYRNIIVVVTKKDIELHPYKSFRKLNQYIFKEQVIQRNFIITKKHGEFAKLLGLATNDKEHFDSVCTSIGYLISSYKNPSLAKAVIITDILSQVKNEAYGRSGKGLMIQALSKIINVVEYNGKATDLSKDKFVFQNVELKTSLLVLQDVTKGFMFESLFSTLTDTMSIERKHRSKIGIPFKKSPKVALTTNHTIPQETDSFKDRKHLVTLNNFFNAHNKPEHHLKGLLFDWNEKGWQKFDNFMIYCVRLFLKRGLVTYDSKELKIKKLISLTSEEFFELMESKYDVLNDYFSLKQIAAGLSISQKSNSAKSRSVGQWLEAYAAFKGYKVERRDSGGFTKICFKT